MERTVQVVEAALTLVAGTDERAPGGEVTVELCGHWEHEGPCRYPHHTEVRHQDDVVVVRTVFAAAAEEADLVAGRIVEALRSGTAWQVDRAGRVPLRGDEWRMASGWTPRGDR